jgi:hypothetical protein
MHIILLLVALNIGHFIGDYTHLSTNWMLSAKRLGKPLTPIFIHALIHTLLVQVVLMLFNVFGITMCILMAFELITHFLIDVLKGRLNGWFPSLQKPTNKFHWYIFGLDQLLHQVVIILMVGYIQ